MAGVTARRALGVASCLIGLLLTAPGRLDASGATPAATACPVQVTFPEVVLDGVPFSIELQVTGEADFAQVVLAGTAAAPEGSGWSFAGQTPAEQDGGSRTSVTVDLIAGQGKVAQAALNHAGEALLITAAGSSWRVDPPRMLPGWLAILPPLVAIGLALLTRQVHLALLLGVWCGAWMLCAWNPLLAFMRLGDRFLVDALTDRSHASILIFSTLLSGMVGMLSQAGATEGIVARLSGRVRNRRQGQRMTAVMGTVIFFDDYANTLLVGNSMRPLTDKLCISREKLAYLVDSTAAPIATVAVISTWVGFEVGLIQEAMAQLGQSGSAYTFFLQTIPYGFYPLLTIWFVYLVAVSGRDFGSMLAAERRAYGSGQVLRPGAQPATDTMAFQAKDAEGRPAHPLIALLPIGLVIATTAVGLWWDGMQKLVAAGNAEPSLRQIVNEADSFAVLMWASLAGVLAAAVLCRATGRLSLRGVVEGWLAGARAMLIALVILLLAWALSAVCTALQTAPYLVDVCRDWLSARWLPSVTFMLAAAIGFATGTSWGTMAILMPLIFPLGSILPASEGLTPAVGAGIHLAAVSAVLAGAVFGDHCSPISDTTIMSSLASGSDHIDHVRTQLPYALTVALVALVSGYAPAGYGLAPGYGLVIGAALLLGVVLWRGRRSGG